MGLSAIALLLLAQTKGAKETNLYWAGSPRLESSAGVSAEFHNVKIAISGGSATVEATTLYRNRGDKPAPAAVHLPLGILGYDAGGPGRAAPFIYSARWMDQPVSAKETVLADAPPARHPRFLYEAKYEVTVPARGSASLKTSISLPLQTLGLDGMQRKVRYAVGAMPGLGELQISITYPPAEVFHLSTITPRAWGWQYGDRGAFVRLVRPTLTGGDIAEMVWYRGGFGGVGGG